MHGQVAHSASAASSPKVSWPLSPVDVVLSNETLTCDRFPKVRFLGPAVTSLVSAAAAPPGSRARLKTFSSHLHRDDVRDSGRA